MLIYKTNIHTKKMDLYLNYSLKKSRFPLNLTDRLALLLKIKTCPLKVEQIIFHVFNDHAPFCKMHWFLIFLHIYCILNYRVVRLNFSAFENKKESMKWYNGYFYDIWISFNIKNYNIYNYKQMELRYYFLKSSLLLLSPPRGVSCTRHSCG